MSWLSRSRYPLYGVAMLLAAVAFVGLCLAYYNQAFTPVAHVSLHTPRAGLQLLPGSDVKVRGLIVGDVASIDSDGSGAVVALRLHPDQLELLPDNVSARLVPKTLFGEKYVDLVLPPDPSSRHLHEGDVIAEDRTTPALEIGKALDDLLPLLRTVQPAKLNATLTALATALAGRGERLGTTIEQLDTYLRGLNPHLPAVEHDLTALVGVTATYDEAATSLLSVLRDLTVTSATVVDRDKQLGTFLTDLTGAVDSTRDLLARSEQGIVSVNRLGRGVLSLLATYSPEFPCFFRGYAKLIPNIHGAIPKTPGLNHSAHVVIEFVPSFPAYQHPLDLPEFKDTRGPSCYGLPSPPQSLPVIQFKDGTEDDPRFNHGPAPAGSSAAMGQAGTAEEKGPVNALLGPVLGLPSGEVPDLADLLFGPMGRGSSVALS